MLARNQTQPHRTRTRGTDSGHGPRRRQLSLRCARRRWRSSRPTLPPSVTASCSGHSRWHTHAGTWISLSPSHHGAIPSQARHAQSCLRWDWHATMRHLKPSSVQLIPVIRSALLHCQPAPPSPLIFADTSRSIPGSGARNHSSLRTGHMQSQDESQKSHSRTHRQRHCYAVHPRSPSTHIGDHHFAPFSTFFHHARRDTDNFDRPQWPGGTPTLHPPLQLT